VGNWINVSVETDELYYDRNDDAATLQYNVDRYNKYKHLGATSAADSLKLFKTIQTKISEIRKNGPIKLALNSNGTYSWEGALYVPDHHGTGTFEYTVTGNPYLIFHERNENKLAPLNRWKINTFDNTTLSVMYVSCTLNYTIFTFKRL
jgi:hypothetical protein